MAKDKKISAKIEEEKVELEEVREQLKKYLDKCNREIREMSNYLKDWAKEAHGRLKNIDAKLSSYEKNLEKLTEINETVEETLANVLLAIRQNEYLQAWYPEQQGHPEMKVVGRHPLQAKREE